MSSAALSIRALRIAERGIDTCSEIDERGGLSLSAAAQDMGHSSRHRDTMESTTTWTQVTRDITHFISLFNLCQTVTVSSICGFTEPPHTEVGHLNTNSPVDTSRSFANVCQAI